MNPDKDRLDWLERSGASLYAFRLDNGQIGAWGCQHESIGWCRGASARDAIDMTRELVGELSTPGQIGVAKVVNVNDKGDAARG